MNKRVFFVVIIVLIGAIIGCFPVTIRTDAAQSATDPARPMEGTVHRLFWGFFPLGGDYIARECSAMSLQRVNVHTNWWETIVTVLTAGIYCPVEVNYLCAKQDSPVSLIKESADIQPLLFKGDTLTALWINGLRQAPLDWQWDAWMTNARQQSVTQYTVKARQDTLLYLLRSINNQIDYTIGFLNAFDTSLHIHKLSQ